MIRSERNKKKKKRRRETTKNFQEVDGGRKIVEKMQGTDEEYRNEEVSWKLMPGKRR